MRWLLWNFNSIDLNKHIFYIPNGSNLFACEYKYVNMNVNNNIPVRTRHYGEFLRFRDNVNDNYFYFVYQLGYQL
jgi:hypothetical protein